MTQFYNGIHKSVDTLQVSPTRLGYLADYNSLNEFIEAHLNYLNNWGGTPDFSFFDKAKENIRDIDNYVLIEERRGGYFIKELV